MKLCERLWNISDKIIFKNANDCRAKSVTFRHAFGSQISIKTARETGGVLQECLRRVECQKQTDTPVQGFQKGSIPFALGHPTGARAPYWPEESKETRGFVAHDFAGKVSCVIPFVDADAGKGWLRELQALSGGSRTGGVWVSTLLLFG